ncbi:MAG: N-6 DNA methylase, partial [Fusobacteriaceae bacterium]
TVLPHGVLFRGAAEGVIREYLIKEKNYLDAVIGLPANIFYGTSIPTVILVFKKSRQQGDNILFIDASNDFEKVKTKNVLRESDLDKIIQTYEKRKTVEKYSYVVNLEEIAENGYNLNIPRYVDNFEKEEVIDLEKIVKELKNLSFEIKSNDCDIKKYCDILGIEAPIF